MGGVVHIPWYATVLRQDHLAEAIAGVAPLALRYGATKYQIHRSLDDRGVPFQFRPGTQIENDRILAGLQLLTQLGHGDARGAQFSQ